MQYLPNADEQEWLIRYLRKLIERAGWEHFVRAPILEPMRNWFPEKWSGRVADAHIVMQRLMHYAGLDAVRVILAELEPPEEEEEEGNERFDTAAFFSGIVDGTARFGVKVDILDEPEKAAGTLAHEVAHAWREKHKLVVHDDRDREELLTDVTTIYLGFGIFTTNNTDRFRTAGDIHQQRWSFLRVGYLPMQAMAFLLALQASARDDREETAKIERHLEPNQARAFREAMEHFEGEDVLSLLSLPPRTTWPEIERTPHKIAVYEPEAWEAIEEERHEEDERWNRGRYVYRLRGTPSWIGIAAIVVSMLAFGALVRASERAGPIANALLAAIAVLIAMGNHFRTFKCSDAECSAPIPREAFACPGCGAGVAANAEEALERNTAADDDVACSACEPEMPCPRHA